MWLLPLFQLNLTYLVVVDPVAFYYELGTILDCCLLLRLLRFFMTEKSRSPLVRVVI